jgi:hypothetical protein
LTDVLAIIAGTLAKQGAPVLGSLIGTAIGGPAGAAIGGMAGKAIEALADALGSPATPEGVADALNKPGAADAVQSVEANVAALLPLWMAQEQRAIEAQRAEIERGFGSWNARRNFAHYVAWGLPLIAGIAAVYAFLTGAPSAIPLASLFASTTVLTVIWTTANSGGKAVADAVTAWRGGK